MKHCPKPNTPTGIGVNAATGQMIVHKFGCKMWNCPYCSEKRKNYLAHKCYFGIELYKSEGIKNWYFGTLTMHRNWRGWASIVNFQTNWNKFYQRMKRDTEGKLLYALLPEKHKDGSLHVHLISTCQCPTNWWKDKGAECGMGFQNENEYLDDSARAAFYVTKYVGKSIGITDWPPRFRRVRYSIRWPNPPKNEDWTWTIAPAELAKHLVLRREEMGYELVNSVTGEIINADRQSPLRDHLSKF